MHATLVSSLGRARELLKIQNILLREARSLEAQKHVTIKLAKQSTITAETESSVIVEVSCHGCMTVESIQAYK